MCKSFIRALIFFALLCPGPVLAHGGHDHVLGTVTAADASHVEVKTRDGKTISVLLDKDTKFVNGKKTASQADLKPGTRIMIDAAGAGDKLTAKEVHLGIADKAKGEDTTGKTNGQKQ